MGAVVVLAVAQKAMVLTWEVGYAFQPGKNLAGHSRGAKQREKSRKTQKETLDTNTQAILSGMRANPCLEFSSSLVSILVQNHLF